MEFVICYLTKYDYNKANKKIFNTHTLDIFI